MSPRIHDFDGDPPQTERTLLSKIENALDNVLQESSLDPDQSSVKRQKYTWLAIEEFTEPGDHPITLSWFKWGISALAASGGATSSTVLVADMSRAGDLADADIEEIEDFLRSDDHGLPLEEWWEADFLDFLQYFYTHKAPEKYRELYLANIRLLNYLNAIDGAVHGGHDPASRSMYEDVCSATSDLKREVRSSDWLEANYEYVSEFTRLFEDVVMVLADMNGEDIERKHQTAISELKSFYVESVWLMIAHSISLESAVGPNQDKIIGWSSSNLEELRAGFEETHRMNRKICEAVDLLPDLDDYQDFETDDEEFEETVDEFMAVVDGRQSSD